MPLTVLERAKRAFYRKKYNDVITLLEPNTIQYRDSFTFYLYLGMACLHPGDIGGATTYFQRARQIKMRDPELLVAQAALHLRRGDTHQAVEYYLEALEYAPSHRLARKSLDFIRKGSDPETISALVETGKIARFYPRIKRPLTAGRIAAKAVPLALVALAAVLLYRGITADPGPVRADLSALELDSADREDAIAMSGSYRYVLTEKELFASYEKAQKFFQSYRDNAAQVEINRILNSNASVAIKRKSRELMGYLSRQGFDTIQDVYTYAQVSKEPWLYLDCWVVWKGMATNVVSGENAMVFDLLVGYDTRDVLEGIVPVRFGKVLSVDPEKPLEVLGQVGLEGGKVILTGSAIHQSGRPGE